MGLDPPQETEALYCLAGRFCGASEAHGWDFFYNLHRLEETIASARMSSLS